MSAKDRANSNRRVAAVLGGVFSVAATVATGCAGGVGPDWESEDSTVTSDAVTPGIETEGLHLGPASKLWCVVGANGKTCTNNDGSNTFPAANVKVCWESAAFTDPSLAAMRAANENGFRQTWARYGRVSFVPSGSQETWGQCASPTQSGIHLWVDVPACGGQNTGVGRDMDGIPNGQRLPSCISAPGNCGVIQTDAETCSKFVALHEFGHDLGLYHENQRTDYSSGSCWENNGFVGPKLGGMDCNINYGSPAGATCSAMWSIKPAPCGVPNVNQTFLTPGDIAGIQRLYGRRTAKLVATNGRCAHVDDAATTGNTLFSQDCENPFQGSVSSWTYDQTSRKFNMFLGGNTYWLGTGSSSETLVKTRNTNSGGSRWSFNNVEIRGWGGLCLDLDGGNTNGGNVWTWYCGAGAGVNQKWTLTDGHQIRFGSTNSCLTAPSSGSQVRVTPCENFSRWRWDLNSDGQIVSQNSGLCLDVVAPWDSDYLNGQGVPTNQLLLKVFPCAGNQFNQKFFFTGPIQNDYGRCLERGDSLNGEPLTQASCDGSNSQTWDYYPGFE